jgi:hypothetical protein
MTTTTEATTVEDLRADLARAEENYRAIRAGNQRAVYARIAEVRGLRGMHERLAQSGDRDVALAWGKLALPEHSPDALARLLDAPASLTRAKASLPSLEVMEAEAHAQEEEAAAAVRSAEAALHVEYERRARLARGDYDRKILAAGAACLDVFRQRPPGVGDDADHALVRAETALAAALARIRKRLNPPETAPGPTGYDGAPLRPGKILVRLLQNVRDDDRNTMFSKGDRVDFPERQARDLIKRKVAELVATH